MVDPPPSIPRETLATEHAGTRLEQGERRYLAVFEASSSRVVPLPESGELLVGRGDDVAIRVRDAKVSRQHVRLTVSPNGVVLTDLGSQNGSFVNGERVTGSRLLLSGDLVDLGSTSIVLHARGAPSAPPDAFRRLCDKLAHEIDRAERGGKAPGLTAFELANTEATEAEAALEPELVGLEQAACDGHSRVVVLMPDASPETAAARTRDLLAQLGARGISARAGLASYPGDGCEPDALLAAARRAASEGEAGALRNADSAFRELDLGDARVLLADSAMLELYALIERLAQSDIPVLIHGETGSGKELAARALHFFSSRRQSRLVAINCAALPESLIESELFGHERGAFTGATGTKVGLLESASGGSVFFDEIAELPLGTQAKLLRTLDTGRIVRVGDVNERPIDVRLVAATHRHLEREVAAGRFRQDLYFRLSGATLWLPPLAHRPRELSLLARRFLELARARLGRPALSLSDDALRALSQHSWPGNVRELKNVMEFLAATEDGPVIQARQLSLRLTHPDAEPPEPPAKAPAGTFRSLEEEVRDLERMRITEALAATGGNQTRAAELIQMPLRTFVSRLTELGLRAKKR